MTIKGGGSIRFRAVVFDAGMALTGRMASRTAGTGTAWGHTGHGYYGMRPLNRPAGLLSGTCNRVAKSWCRCEVGKKNEKGMVKNAVMQE